MENTPQKGWCVCVKYIWDIVIKVNVHKTEIPEETKREARAILWQIMAVNFPKPNKTMLGFKKCYEHKQDKYEETTPFNTKF